MSRSSSASRRACCATRMRRLARSASGIVASVMALRGRRRAQAGFAPERVLGFLHVAEIPTEVHDARRIGLVELDAAFMPILAEHAAAPRIGHQILRSA